MKKSGSSLLLAALLIFILLSRPPLFPGDEKPFRSSIYNRIEEIAGYKERPLVLVFISLACHVCWEELFEMKDFVDGMSLPVTLVGVATESRERLEQFVRRYAFSYPLIEDQNKTLFRQFRVRLEPFVVVLDSTGEVFHLDDPALDFQTRRELNKKKILELLEK